jgi:peptidyl-prolyl cis-trans isomerase C
MPIFVNSEVIPRELIREEERRLGELPEWRSEPDGLEKRMRLREAAEMCAINGVLLRQETDKDPRPIDADLVTQEVQKLQAANGCRVLFDDGPLRRQIEGQLRLQRTMRELTGPLEKPTDAEIARFYQAQRRNFQRPETILAAHIVKHIDETHSEEQARAGIQAALAELQRGEPFAEVAERHSDCKGNGGDLGWFERGTMVDEFDDVVFRMKPGERSAIFRTPFGFHIAEVRGRKPPGHQPLAEVKEDIARFLMAMLEREAMRQATEKLRQRAEIRRSSAETL